jgi:hypothetical protein
MQFAKLDTNFVFAGDVELQECPLLENGEQDPHYVAGPAPQGYILPGVDQETGKWHECGTPPELVIPEPTLEERNRADIDYLAMMMEVEL